ADADIGAFKHGQVETVLVAEIVIDHPLVGARALGDRVDTRAGVALLGEFGHGGGQNRRAGALGIARPRAAGPFGIPSLAPGPQHRHSCISISAPHWEARATVPAGKSPAPERSASAGKTPGSTATRPPC